LSVISVCAGLAGDWASFVSASALPVTPNIEAAAAPTPSPAYFKTSLRVVTLGSRFNAQSPARLPRPFISPDSIQQNRHWLSDIEHRFLVSGLTMYRGRSLAYAAQLIFWTFLHFLRKQKVDFAAGDMYPFDKFITSYNCMMR
jgi:hypothetical protein